MTELWLVRHGQTDWNVEGRYQGQKDVPLNEIGFVQARELAENIKDNHFFGVYSSDLSRAWQTAEVLADRLGIKVQRDQRLREIYQGKWEGMLFEDVKKEFPTELDDRIEDPLHARAPGGESVKDVADRVALALDDISRTYPDGAVLVVMHGLALATVLCQAAGESLDGVFSKIPKNAQVHVVKWPPQKGASV